MSRLNTHQEILLVQGTGFASRQFCENKETKAGVAGNYLTQHEKLKEACWNGQLKDMIPELFFHFPEDSKMYMWQMREGEGLLTMEMSEEPSELDFQASIDPYIVMEIQLMN
jgi:hypothetical protein